MNHVSRLSEAVFEGMCHEVGTSTQVRTRREVVDTFKVVMRSMCVMRGFDRMNSGSYREGFRLRTSDINVMFSHPNHKVICDLSQLSLCRTPKHTVILMEGRDLQPGYRFSRLKMITTSSDEKVNESRMEIIAENDVTHVVCPESPWKTIQKPNTSKDISWQILGICQEMCGDYEEALDSFQSSLYEIPFHHIEISTYIRMQTIINRVFM